MYFIACPTTNAKSDGKICQEKKTKNRKNRKNKEKNKINRMAPPLNILVVMNDGGK